VFAAAEALLPPGAVRCSTALAQERFEIHPLGDCACGSSHDANVVECAGANVGEFTNERDALQFLRSEIKLWVAANSPDGVFVHAGAVGWNGRAVVLPGRSLSGKSTLVRALLAAGATYLSDDMAVIDVSGAVHPYAQPISQRPMNTPIHSRMHRADLDIARTGATIATGPLLPTLVIMTDFQPGGRFRPVLMTAGAATLAVMEHCVTARRRPEAALDAIVALCGQATCWSGSRGDTAALVDLVVEYLGEPGLIETRSRE
jgi:hypothetical protein